MKQPNPDNMRYMLDLLCEATDETLEDSIRLAMATELADLSNLRDQFVIAREYYRELANRRTDNIKPVETP